MKIVIESLINLILILYCSQIHTVTTTSSLDCIQSHIHHLNLAIKMDVGVNSIISDTYVELEKFLLLHAIVVRVQD